MKKVTRNAVLRIGFLSTWIAFQTGFLFTQPAACAQFEWIKPSLQSLPAPRSSASLAYDTAAKTLVLFGGASNNLATIYNDTWTFTPALGWSQLSPATSPSPRTGAGFAYDISTGTVVLFGGNNGSELLNDTWTWDGTTWTQQFPPVSPSPRSFNTPQMVYDAISGTTLLFGGYGSNGAFFGDTWSWDGKGKRWVERFPATSPSPRGTTLTYDPLYQQVLMFGGEDGGASFLNQTWVWNGTWTQLFPATSPSPRTNLAMTFDPGIGSVVLFGGYNFVGGQALNDTWIWNGTTWSQIQTSLTPAGRYCASMAYDPSVKGLVLFGGFLTDGPWTNQTWLFYGPTRISAR
jgi:hypothetical protein